jgi:hypothetical protein
MGVFVLATAQVREVSQNSTYTTGWSISAIRGNQGCSYARVKPGYFVPAGHFENKMEERSTARVRFSAPAEVIRADLVEATSVTELSLHGCYLEPTTPLPRGTLVTVKIFAGDEFFEATATVLYSRATPGAGIGFRGVKAEFQIVLRKWMRQALDKSYAPP